MAIKRCLELREGILWLACFQQDLAEQFVRGFFHRRSGRTSGLALERGGFAQRRNCGGEITRVGARTGCFSSTLS